MNAHRYIRSLDRRLMVEIKPGSFVNARSAFRLGLIKQRRHRPASDNRRYC